MASGRNQKGRSLSHRDPLLTPAEVAARLRLSVRTIYRYIRDGRLTATVLPGGKQCRILLSTVEALLQGDRAPPCEAHPGTPLTVRRARLTGNP